MFVIIFPILQSSMGVVHPGNMTVTPKNVRSVFVAGVHLVAAGVVTGDDITPLIFTIPGISGEHLLIRVDHLGNIHGDVVIGFMSSVPETDISGDTLEVDTVVDGTVTFEIGFRGSSAAFR